MAPCSKKRNAAAPTGSSVEARMTFFFCYILPTRNYIRASGYSRLLSFPLVWFPCSGSGHDPIPYCSHIDNLHSISDQIKETGRRDS